MVALGSYRYDFRRMRHAKEYVVCPPHMPCSFCCTRIMLRSLRASSPVWASETGLHNRRACSQAICCAKSLLRRLVLHSSLYCSQWLNRKRTRYQIGPQKVHPITTLSNLKRKNAALLV